MIVCTFGVERRANTHWLQPELSLAIHFTTSMCIKERGSNHGLLPT